MVTLTVALLPKLAMNPQGTTWQKHVRGLAELLQWRGPQGFQSPRNARVIFFLCLYIVSGSFRRRCFQVPSRYLGFLTVGVAPPVYLIEAAHLLVPTTVAEFTDFPPPILALVRSAAGQQHGP
jgi:hypothetical protein